jgi:hypothetical protein
MDGWLAKWDACSYVDVSHESCDHQSAGDFVDRGSWGLETLILLLVYKWLFPNNVYLIRGNHESSYCTSYYGKGPGHAHLGC